MCAFTHDIITTVVMITQICQEYFRVRQGPRIFRTIATIAPFPRCDSSETVLLLFQARGRETHVPCDYFGSMKLRRA